LARLDFHWGRNRPSNAAAPSQATPCVFFVHLSELNAGELDGKLERLDRIGAIRRADTLVAKAA
jgi:hypothetical protein